MVKKQNKTKCLFIIQILLRLHQNIIPISRLELRKRRTDDRLTHFMSWGSLMEIDRNPVANLSKGELGYQNKSEAKQEEKNQL